MITWASLGRHDVCADSMQFYVVNSCWCGEADSIRRDLLFFVLVPALSSRSRGEPLLCGQPAFVSRHGWESRACLALTVMPTCRDGNGSFWFRLPAALVGFWCWVPARCAGHGGLAHGA
jgi:hypothetical protein